MEPISILISTIFPHDGLLFLFVIPSLFWMLSHIWANIKTNRRFKCSMENNIFMVNTIVAANYNQARNTDDLDIIKKHLPDILESINKTTPKT